MPLLFFTGTRDAFCDLDLLRKVLDRLKTDWDLELIDGGDHSLGLLKSANKTQDEVYAHVLGRMVDWVKTKCKGEESDDNPQRSGQTRNTNPAG